MMWWGSLAPWPGVLFFIYFFFFLPDLVRRAYKCRQWAKWYKLVPVIMSAKPKKLKKKKKKKKKTNVSNNVPSVTLYCLGVDLKIEMLR